MSKNYSKKIIGTVFFFVFIFPLLIPIFNIYKTDVNHLNYSENISISGDISDIDLSVISEINYTALNTSWYEPKIEMLIIVPDNIVVKQDYIDAVTPLMNWKNEKGVKTIILSNYTSYPGVDPQEKIRNMIKDFYNKENIQWVLLAGDAQTNRIPIRTIPNTGAIGEPDPTDFYYADLDSDWSNLTNLDWTAEVYVGRLPADTSTQLSEMVNKTVKYESDPEIGDWMNRMLLAGGISNYPEPEEGDYDGEDEARLTQYLWQNYIQEEMNFTHLHRTTNYFDPIPSEGEASLTQSNFRNEVNTGYSAVFFAGHGSDGSFADADITVFTSFDALIASNENMPFLIYSDACSTAKYDQDGGIGEILIRKSNSGAIGYIGGMRDTYYLQEDPEFKKLNRGNAKYFWMEFFENNKYQQGRALYDSKATYANSAYVQLVFAFPNQTTLESPFPFAHRRNLMTYNLLGDPELDIYTDVPKSVSNPFEGNIYEGQLISINLNPYAKVHLRNEFGAYRTVYAGEDGVAKIRLPPGAGITYNVTITGHNYIPSHFNFTTLLDEKEPLPTIYYTPTISTTFTNIKYNIYTNESESGIECIYTFMSTDDFDSYTTHLISNDYPENESILEIDLHKLNSDQHKYSFFIYARDYANNTQTYSTSILISIAAPLSNYLLIVASIMIIGFSGISVYVVYSGIKKYSIIYKRMEER
jgi:hypothetical protein